MINIFQYIGLLVLFLVGIYLYFLSFYIELKILRYRSKRYSEYPRTKGENERQDKKYTTDSDVTHGLFKLLQGFYAPLFDGIIDHLLKAVNQKRT